MATSKALREQRAALIRTTRKETLDKAESENRAMNTEEQATWNRVFGHTDPDGKAVTGEVDALMTRIDAIEKADAVEAGLLAPAGDPRVGRTPITPAGDGAQVATEEHRSLALNAWCRVQMGGTLTEAQEAACRLVRLNPAARNLDMPLLSTADAQALQRRYRSAHHNRAVDHCNDFRATLTIGSGTGGGYLIPPETMLRQIEVNMLAYGGMRQVAEIIRTATGERLSWPTADDTTNTGVQLGESASVGSSVDPTFGKVYWDAYKFSSKPILVPYELLQDSVFDLPNLIGNFFGERLGRVTNTKYTTGNGAATAKGIVTAASAFSAASATAITFDDIMGLEHSVDPAYRTGAGFMLHDSILLAIRKLKDGEGRYLWQSDQQSGRPDTLHGYGLTNNQDMDSTVASGKKTILFGRLSAYKIRSVGTMRMYRLEERYRDTDQDGFVAFLREDGNLLTAGTPPVKYLSH